ncbi:protein kinase family protein [Pontibacter sp. KCTC 32443]|uniref:protein kinase family protein n=1 Tax=Pontibacter TaxID=323449 RepID=UPI00164D85AB|nr:MULTISPECIES: protein kinase family protein [Pontibacter]MBC5772768.1 protein kinase family protein [Pontibacter sp. KCTC 32443]
MFPTIAEYNQVIKTHGTDAFRSLHGLSFVPSRTLPVKIYSYGSGAYAVVFKAKAQSKEYAIRCFISADNETLDRYRSISNYLEGINESWCTEIEILEDEIDVHGRYYPVVKMEWVNGQLLNKYISDNLHNDTILTKLQEQIVKVSDSLEKHSIGHGDIQCGNVLVTKDSSGNPVIKLIDYDGLYIPEFANKTNLEHGRSEFQHPKRTQAYYNEKIDRFSFWVILCALEALKYDKSLWLEVMQGGYNTLDNLLFTGEDFKNFRNSKLVQRLYNLNKPALSFYLNSLEYFCKSPVSSVDKPILYSIEQSIAPKNVNKTETLAEANPEASQGDRLSSRFIEILSSPAGATVLKSTLQKIGETPLKIDKEQYLGKTLIISYGSQVKQRTITDSLRRIDINFSKEQPISPVRNKYKSETQPASHINSPTYVHISSSPKTNITPTVRKKDYTSTIIWSLLAVIIFGTIAVADFKSDTNEEIAYETEETTVEETVVDTTAVEVDTTDTNAISFLDYTKTLGEIYQSPSSSSYLDDNGHSATQAMLQFFWALSNNDCDAVWLKTFIQEWEDKGKDDFCDYYNFGGINDAYIEKANSIQQTESQGVFRVNYSTIHPYSGMKCYQQDIKLEKINFTDGTTTWMITEMKNIVTPYSCEYVD